MPTGAAIAAMLAPPMEGPPEPPRDADASSPPFILEQGERLSRSILWRLQRRFFEGAGMLAWSDGIVPHYITSNPFIARAYVEVVLGFARDVATRGEGPLYVIELGAGVGRFAFHFLRRLSRALEDGAFRGVPIRYVITDFTPLNIEALRSHPSLRPFVAAKILDFAVFDAERDTSLGLLESGDELAPKKLGRPPVVIANYFFDGLPQDVFRVEGGRLHEGRVTLTTASPPEDPEAPALLDGASASFSYHPITEPRYYGDPDLDGILDEYRDRLGRTSVLFPTAAFQCLRALLAIAGGRLLLLSGDKGIHREEDLLDREAPVLTKHGSLSLTVNHHALARFVERAGGLALHAARSGSPFEIAAFLTDPEHAAYTETRRAHAEAIERLGPDDFFVIKKAIERSHREWTAQEILAWIRMSGYDFNITFGCLPALWALAPGADPALRSALRRAVHEVWESYFPIGEQRDLAFSLAALLFAMDYYDDAITFYERSVALYGPTAMTAYHLALCHARLHRAAPALASVEEALAIDPLMESAKALRIRLQAEIAAGERRR